MRHPTPAEIRLAVSHALLDDIERAADDPYIRQIPVRVFRLIDEAFTKACDDAQSASQS